MITSAQSQQPKTLFLWWGSQGLPVEFLYRRTCLFCPTRLVTTAYEQRDGLIIQSFPYGLAGIEWNDQDETLKWDDEDGTSGGSESYTYDVCPLCGWILVSYDTAFFGLAGQGCFASALREFNISDPAVALAELGTHLKRSFSDVYSLSWQRFEDLVADVFRCNYASDVIQTARSADGGADILLLSSDGKSVDAVVECKRYAQNRKISVALVRQMIGVCVDWQVSRAMIVTSSSFSSNATSLASRFKLDGFVIDLIGASELLKLLECYNETLPPLEILSASDRKDLVLQNQDAIKNSIVVPNQVDECKTSNGWRLRRTVGVFRVMG